MGAMRAMMRITRENLEMIGNAALRDYAQRYLAIADTFKQRIEQDTGLAFQAADPLDAYYAQREQRLNRLAEKGAWVRNNGKSVGAGWLSSACEACVTGRGSATYYHSLACRRKCFYCFNPNQARYETDRTGLRDASAELLARSRAGEKLHHVALTGGEPLLHPDRTMDFIEMAVRLHPGIHTRLYTAGDSLDGPMAAQLADSGLREVRISIKAEEGEAALQRGLAAVSAARQHIPEVMVEMPVIPVVGASANDGSGQDAMEGLLRRLDEAGADGINLLEFCFPLHNAGEFSRRGFRLKDPAYDVYFNWGYAGGLPVAGSEDAALDLVEFSLDAGLSLGVHYCSLENKLSAEVYRLNHPAFAAGEGVPSLEFSQDDFYFKALKAFGDDIPPARSALRGAGAIEGRDMEVNDDYGFLQFHPRFAPAVAHLDALWGVSYQVREMRDGAPLWREVRLDAAKAGETPWDAG